MPNRPIIPEIPTDKKERKRRGKEMFEWPRNEEDQDKYGKEGLRQMTTGYTIQPQYA